MASRKRPHPAPETPQSMRKSSKQRRTTSSEQDIETAKESITWIDHVALSLGQHGKSQQIKRVIAQLSSSNFKVKVGVAGMTNAGKSTALNALLGAKFLPASFQAQTAVKLCIANTTDKQSGGQLFAKKHSEKNFPSTPLASGQKEIQKCILDINKKSRLQSVQNSDLCLKIPVPFLQGKPDISVEIYDTPGINESGNSGVSAIGSNAIEEMAAIILILDGGAVGTKGQDELVQELRHFHPLMESHGRVLILINKYDSLFDGNKESWTPEQLKTNVSRLFPSKCSSNVIAISAKYALKAREWQTNPGEVSKYDYGELYNFLMKQKQAKDYVSSEMEEMCPENVKSLAHGLEEFSQIKKVESKLLEMLCERGQTILLQSAVDDSLRITSELKGIITQKHSDTIVQCDAKREEISNQQDVITKVKRVITHGKQTLDRFPSHASTDLATQLDAAALGLKNDLMTHISAALVQLHGDFNDQGSAHQRLKTVKQGIVSRASSLLQQNWPSALTLIERAVSRLLQFTYDGIVTKASADINLECINIDTIIPNLIVSPPSPPTISAIDDSALNALVYPHTITKQRTEIRHKRGPRRYGLFGPREKQYYQVTVDYTETVYRVRMAVLQTNFNDFALHCSNRMKTKAEEAVKNLARKASNQIKSAIEESSSQYLHALKNELATKQQAFNKWKAEQDNLQSLMTKLDDAEVKLQTIIA